MSKLQTAEGGFATLEQSAGQRQARQAADLSELFIGTLGEWLDRRLDRAFSLALAALAPLRHQRSGLLLSELGSRIIAHRIPDRESLGIRLRGADYGSVPWRAFSGSHSWRAAGSSNC